MDAQLERETSFRDWLKEHRKEYGYTQQELADRVGCSVVTMSRIEEGVLRPSRQLAELIVESLEAPPVEREQLVMQARTDPLKRAPGSAPFLRGSSQYPAHNLPTPITPLIGREGEIAAVSSLLIRYDVRLLTLTGAPGVGKTRLAIAVAEEAVALAHDGVWFVDLSPLRDPRLVVSSIAQVLGLKEMGGTPLIDILTQYLREKESLLVLDNFEQVADAAKEVSHLLASCPHLKVLVTSRTPLRIEGEHEYPVSPLALPDLDHLPSVVELCTCASIRLFNERAEAIRPDFALSEETAEPVAQICVRLDGLPLAIELAAARTRLFSPQAMVKQLQRSLKLLTGGARNLPARQQTLQAAIEWSYHLLSEGEQQLFRRMAVFQGGQTLDALETVCNYDNRLDIEVLDGIESLVEKCLVQEREGRSREPRFWMLETIHDYVRAKLSESGEGEALAREHARYFLGLCEQAEPHLTSPDQQEWYDKLQDEHDNLRSALLWAQESGKLEDIDAGLRAGSALDWFWTLRGYYSEGREHLHALLEKVACLCSSLPAIPRSLEQSRAKALAVEGRLANWQDDLPAAQTLTEQALRLAREVGDSTSVAEALHNLGDIALGQWTPGVARPLYEESLAIRRELGDKVGIATSLVTLAGVAQEEGDYTVAQRLLEESLAMKRELGHKALVARTLEDLGQLVVEKGNYDYAHALLTEGLALSKELGYKELICITILSMASLAVLEGDYASAHALLEETMAMAKELGLKYTIGSTLEGMGDLAEAQGDDLTAAAYYDEVASLKREMGMMVMFLSFSGQAADGQGEYARARALHQEALALFVRNGGGKGVAETLVLLGRVFVNMGQVGRGAVLLAGADKLMRTLGGAMRIGCQIACERAKASAQAQLGDVEFQEVWKQGEAMTMDQAIAYAQEGSDQIEGDGCKSTAEGKLRAAQDPPTYEAT